MTTLTRLAAGLGLALAISCGGLTDSDNDQIHNEARAKWAAAGPASYAMTVNRTCICDGPQEPVRVTVENGAVVTRRIISTGDLVTGQASEYPSVPGLFAIIDNARSSSAFSLTVEYDPTLGYPVLINLNLNPGSVTDDRFYSITDFTPAP